MQRGPDREPLTKDDLAALTSAAFTNLMAGKVKETAALFCAASAAAKYGQHTGDGDPREHAPLPRTGAARLILKSI